MSSKQPRPVVIDFETLAIQARPHYPPPPVGLAVKYPGKAPRYLAFGHRGGNTHSWGEARAALAAAYAWAGGVLGQNLKFDVEVAEQHLDLPVPPWEQLHDTMFLLFLHDPHQRELSLKPAAERLLGLPPTARDAVADWLLAEQPVPGVRLSSSRGSPSYYGAYLGHAPGELVSRYGCDDVVMTEGLFNLLWPQIRDRGMLAAYDRERRLMPTLLRLEQAGLPVALGRLRRDVEICSAWQERLDAWLRRELRVGPELNLDSGEQLADALLAAGKLDLMRAARTATGKLSTSKEALPQALTDPRLVKLLRYRAALKTTLGTFAEPWLVMAEATGGTIHTTWHQVRGAKGNDTAGTRTGRLSATWFMNMPKELTDALLDPAKLPADLAGLPPLPNCRSYIIPGPGRAFIDRDWCFSSDTEVLTRRGFVLFQKLEAMDEVAQWEAGSISFAKPLCYQTKLYIGNLVHIVGERSTDLLVTPNHRCLLLKGEQAVFVRADQYDRSHTQQLHAGIYVGGANTTPVALVKLAVAIQADATIKHGATLAWKLKKERKIARLHALLTEAEVQHVISRPASAPGYAVTYVRLDELPAAVSELIDLSDNKTFRPVLRELSLSARQAFLRELAWWDGRRGKVESHWSYFTTNEKNASLVQELAALTGLRSVASKMTLPSGKIFTDVSLRTTCQTWTKTYSLKDVPYNGAVYCVTMPAGTVIIRRNGRVCVTGNSQQEPRLLAHFEGGALMQQYQADPWLDLHDNARDELAKVGKVYERRPVKNTNLGLIYGMGVGLLAERNSMTVAEAKTLRDAILRMYPGLKAMYADMHRRYRQNEPIRTWGGREIYCEPAQVVDGRLREYDYKLVNLLIQGSGADVNKEAVIRWEARRGADWPLVLDVHDQLTASVPIREARDAMQLLKEVMEGIELDVPLLSEGAISYTDWAHLVDVDKRGKELPWPPTPHHAR